MARRGVDRHGKAMQEKTKPLREQGPKTKHRRIIPWELKKRDNL